MLFKSPQSGIISPGVIPGGIITLQYADDSILFLDNDINMAQNLKWLLTCFEQMFGMHINYHKSDLMTINLSEDEENLFAQVFSCKIGQFPFKYLWVPLHYSKLRKEDLQLVVDKIMKGIAGWRGKLLSYRGRLILLQACIASIPLYLLSILKFPKWSLAMINSHMANFFWDDKDGGHKYHLANWGLIC
jgi:hypothetical protein